MWIKIDDLILPADAAPVPPENALPALLRQRFGVVPEEWHLLGRSVDARRGMPKFQYSVAVRTAATVEGGREIDRAALEKRLHPELILPEEPLPLDSPIVVGTGPCGIFAGLLLALAGCRPVILDRGFDVDRRKADYHRFLKSRDLDPGSNLLIGEGGAGTWSDGKLYTGTSDPRAGFVLRTFAECGAPAEIRFLKRPHIGSDHLPEVARQMRRRLESLGATFRFGTEVVGVSVRDGRCAGVITASGEVLEAPAVLIAAGLGGRGLNRAVRAAGVAYDLKGFQIGCRVEHPQEWVDRQQYRLPSRPAALEAAEYHLSSRPRGGTLQVSSFCMCPGGEIVAASAWPGQSVSNGMSLHDRAGYFANSALIATLTPDLFRDADAAFEQLAAWERAAFAAGGSDHTFPAQDAAGFLRGEMVLRNRRGSAAVGMRPARLDELLPPAVRDALRAALKDFDRRCPGFIRGGKFVGLESCVSSPVRFHRHPESGASSLPGLYLGGEFGGCAGGIMSAAVDGLRLAEKMVSA